MASARHHPVNADPDTLPPLVRAFRLGREWAYLYYMMLKVKSSNYWAYPSKPLPFNFLYGDLDLSDVTESRGHLFFLIADVNEFNWRTRLFWQGDKTRLADSDEKDKTKAPFLRAPNSTWEMACFPGVFEVKLGALLKVSERLEWPKNLPVPEKDFWPENQPLTEMDIAPLRIRRETLKNWKDNNNKNLLLNLLTLLRKKGVDPLWPLVYTIHFLVGRLILSAYDDDQMKAVWNLGRYLGYSPPLNVDGSFYEIYAKPLDVNMSLWFTQFSELWNELGLEQHMISEVSSEIVRGEKDTAKLMDFVAKEAERELATLKKQRVAQEPKQASAMDRRNQWIYEQYMNPDISLKEISKRLKKDGTELTEARIQQIAKQHAVAYTLPYKPRYQRKKTSTPKRVSKSPRD